MEEDKQYYARMYPRLYYVWGHSFEFDRKNNWERLDTIINLFTDMPYRYATV